MGECGVHEVMIGQSTFLLVAVDHLGYYLVESHPVGVDSFFTIFICHFENFDIVFIEKLEAAKMDGIDVTKIDWTKA